MTSIIHACSIANASGWFHNSTMSDQTLADGLKQIFNLYIAWNHKRWGRLEKARRRLDIALSLADEPDHYILAFDGLLMIAERQYDEASARFSKCLRNIEPGMDADNTYVAHYCRLWLNINDAELGYEEIQCTALEAISARSKASRWVQTLLPLASIDKLKEICGHRVSKDTNLLNLHTAEKPSRTMVAFDF